MEKATVLAALSLTVTLLVTGSVVVDACDGVPWMSALAACQQASVNPAMFRTCADTLGTSPDAQEVTGFMLAAANAATESYAAGKAAVGKVLSNPLAPDGERLPCLVCSNKYDDASMLVASTADDAKHCALTTESLPDIITAISAIDDCATAIFQDSGNMTSVYTMAITNRDWSVLVLRLATLLVPPAT
uniref:Pectinesterase inhibitor domain-containing protein n=1 Tax=Oryza punctata TaxID=4537 RepID=A0A0E0LR43_ORYPU